jgi:predicted KAP-like P-loop ATPase
MENFADSPIFSPEQDAFAVNGFAESLAKSICSMDAPEGIVLALNGSWGSGKTSIVNLVAHHCKSNPSIKTIQFNPWWFGSEEALTAAFFSEIGRFFDRSLGEKGKTLFARVGARLLRTAGTVAPIVDAAGGGGVATASSGTLSWIADYLSEEKGIQELHQEASDALKKQDCRFLVIIDDIDRLDPDAAISVFRLVKSVGQLPNVIYLLSFDRDLAESAVRNRFPSEGSHYLEKIIQVSFDIPKLDDDELSRFTLDKIDKIVGPIDSARVVDFMNLFHEVVAPKLTTPRDAFKFINSLSVTFTPVRGEVDTGDFVALEALRVFEPKLYRRIRENGSLLTSSPRLVGDYGNSQDSWALALVGDHPDPDWVKRVLRRLFPICDAVWANTYHTSSGPLWQRNRRACSPSHFETYFRFSLSNKAVSTKILNDFASGKRDAKWIADNAKSYAKVSRYGESEIARIIDGLTSLGPEIEIDSCEPLLNGLFSVADDIYLEADEARGFSIANNRLRLHWLLRSILFDRTSLAERSNILFSAMQGAQTTWMVDFGRSAWEDWYPREGKEITPESECLLTFEHTNDLKSLILEKIREEAGSRLLLTRSEVPFILYNWLDFSETGSQEVTEWTASLFQENESILTFSEKFVSHSWSQGMSFDGLGDLVAKRSTLSTLPNAGTLVDLQELRNCLMRIASDSADTERKSRANQILTLWGTTSLNSD